MTEKFLTEMPWIEYGPDQIFDVELERRGKDFGAFTGFMKSIMDGHKQVDKYDNEIALRTPTEKTRFLNQLLDEPVFQNYLRKNQSNSLEFSHLIAEETVKISAGEVEWLSDISDKMSEGWFPLSPRLIQKLHAEKIHRKAFHVCEYPRTFKMLERIQGKQNTISSTTKPHLAIAGVQAGTGIIAVVEGNVVAKFRSDVMSAVDRAGRRWIHMRMYASGHLEHAVRLGVLKQSEADTLRRITEILSREFGPKEYGHPTFAEFRAYVEYAEKYALKHTQEFAKFLLLNDGYMDGSFYDEVLMNDIRIRKVLIFFNGSESVFGALAWYSDKMDKKYETVDPFDVRKKLDDYLNGKKTLDEDKPLPEEIRGYLDSFYQKMPTIKRGIEEFARKELES